MFAPGINVQPICNRPDHQASDQVKHAAASPPVPPPQRGTSTRALTSPGIPPGWWARSKPTRSYTQQPSQHVHGCAASTAFRQATTYRASWSISACHMNWRIEGVRAKQLLVLLPQVRQRRALKQHVLLVTVRRLAQRAEPLRAGHAPPAASHTWQSMAARPESHKTDQRLAGQRQPQQGSLARGRSSKPPQIRAQARPLRRAGARADSEASPSGGQLR